MRTERAAAGWRRRSRRSRGAAERWPSPQPVLVAECAHPVARGRMVTAGRRCRTWSDEQGDAQNTGW